MRSYRLVTASMRMAGQSSSACSPRSNLSLKQGWTACREARCAPLYVLSHLPTPSLSSDGGSSSLRLSNLTCVLSIAVSGLRRAGDLVIRKRFRFPGPPEGSRARHGPSTTLSLSRRTAICLPSVQPKHMKFSPTSAPKLWDQFCKPGPGATSAEREGTPRAAHALATSEPLSFHLESRPCGSLDC